MPIINVHMLQGRTSEQKAACAKAITDAVVDSLGAPAKSVRVLFVELEKDGFYVAGEPSRGAAAHAAPADDASS